MPTVIWGLRRLGKHPNGYVRTADAQHIEIAHSYGPGYDSRRITIPRADARLLAKRILQCLEETK